MRAHRTAVAIATTCLAVAGTVAVTAPNASAATPRATGCPTSYETLSVAWLASQGPYQLPFVLDAAGNGDGSVCGKALGDLVTQKTCGSPCHVPMIYTFIDNDLTPAH
jgi:hypothetical protein